MALFRLQFGIHNAFPLTTSQLAVRALEAAVMPGLQPPHGPAQPAWPQTPCGPPLGTHCPRHAEGTAPTSPAPASSHWPPDSLPLSHWVLAPSLREAPPLLLQGPPGMPTPQGCHGDTRSHAVAM